MMFFRRRRLPALILLLGSIIGGIPLLVPSEVSAETKFAPLSVLSINVERGGADVSSLSAVIKNQEVDIAILIEADEYLIKSLLSPDIKKMLPYRSGTVSSGGTAGTAMLSKYPLQQEDEISVPAGVTSFDQPVATVDHPQLGSIRIAGVHPYPPISGAIEWKKSLESINSWQSENTDLPLVMAGDFNASYAHPEFREIASSFTDTAASAGILPISTWPASGPIPAFTAIDHVLVRDLSTTSWERVKIPNTDHFGIIAKVTSRTD
ncbi:endonuclease/exonuclease/phosphatase family protein [Paeniglutamicibacter sp. NPDC091659]|uniref:endonuclease/exonuclease/phosphatase family protein n=1 Tax=Paeniglutamicibacter sp. NPDC091659 TaxID=3364389 RepID=UPI003825B98F